MKVRAQYISRIITVIIPSFIIIAGFFVIPYMAYKHLVTDSFLLKLGVNLGGFVVLIVLIILTNPYLVKIARLKRGSIKLEGTVITWRSFINSKSIDLSHHHSIQVQSGPGIKAAQNTSISIRDAKHGVFICFPGMERYDAANIFKDDEYIGTSSVPPEEGTGGFNLKTRKSGHREFFTEILKLAWEQRDNNQIYKIYQLFPWDRQPAPDLHYVRTINEKSEIDNYRQGAIVTIGTELFVLPDYVLALQDEGALLMPLGYTFIHEIVKSRIASTAGGVSTYTVLELVGKDNTGEEIKADMEKNFGAEDDMEIQSFKEMYLMQYAEKVWVGVA